MATAHAFFEIAIGDRKSYEVEKAAYDRAREFLHANADAYGLPTDPADLDDAGRDTVVELYNADPKWKSMGDVRVVAPPPLSAGRLVMEIYKDKVPLAAENFIALCTGEKGISKATKKPLHYKGSKFHRIVKDFVAQGGDITRGDGSGGESIYQRKFKDEKEGLKMSHNRTGTLSMANSGKNSNSSQFFITLVDDCRRLDGKYVVFGRVVEGLEILSRINNEAAAADGQSPRVDVVIDNCGVL